MEGPTRTMSVAALSSMLGRELGVSESITIDQATIDAFADLTGDHYFLHVDRERAAASAFGGTIAHGFLTLSMLAQMAYQACPVVEGSHTNVNYGFNRLRFIAPVRAGARIRARFTLKSFDVKNDGRWQSIHDVVVEIEGEAKPALVAEWIGAGFLHPTRQEV